jgi:hypothetical protein
MDGAMWATLGKLEAGDWKQAEMGLQAIQKNK